MNIPPHIPEIDEATALELLERIQPLVRDDSGQLYKFKRPEGFKALGTSINFVEDRFGEPMDANQLRLLTPVVSFHRTGYHAFFRVQAGEVVAQIPHELLDKVIAFEVLFSHDLVEVVDANGVYGHRAVTLLYGAAPH